MGKKKKALNNNSGDWKSEPFSNTVESVKMDRAKRVPAHAYLSTGKYPIVDQGQELISGWTNDEAAVIKDGLPLIIFGDHTRIFKYINFPFAIGADGTKLIKPQSKFDQRYYYYYLLSLDIPSKGYSRHFKTLKEKEISYPPLPEQKKIAAMLYEIQKAIELQDDLIKKTQELKKSTMQYLFTYGARGEKTKQTEIGEMPENWEVVNLKDKFIFTSRPKGLNYANYKEIAFVPMELIPNDAVHLNNFILKKPEKILSGIYFEQGDLLLSKITPCFENGKQCVISCNIPNGFGIATTEVISIKEIPNISDKYFLFYYLLKSDIRSFIASKMEGATGRQRVPVHIMRELSIPFPCLTEQKELSAILLALDKRIELHNSKKVKEQELFNSMLNKLMRRK